MVQPGRHERWDVGIDPQRPLMLGAPFGAGAAHVMQLGPVGIEQTFDQVVNEVGKLASQARPITPGGKTSNRLCAHDPLRCSLRSSCLAAYRRWLDRAGTFTNMTLCSWRGGTQTERRRRQNCATASQSTQVRTRVLC